MAYKQEEIKPYEEEGSKDAQVERMFDNIAPAYDSLNHLLSLGIDRNWRRKAVEALRPYSPDSVLDIATGTGDFAILTARTLGPSHLVGADISEGMMAIGRQKVSDEGLDGVISFQREDCMALSFQDASFDAVTVAYGIRNYQDLDRGLRETRRVLKEGGHLLIVELGAPRRFPMKQLFWVYSHAVMPVVGYLKSRDRRAYEYLGATMEACPQGEEMADILRKNGFHNVKWRTFWPGMCSMYIAEP